MSSADAPTVAATDPTSPFAINTSAVDTSALADPAAAVNSPADPIATPSFDLSAPDFSSGLQPPSDVPTGPSRPDWLPVANPDGTVSGDVSAYASNLRLNDPAAYAAIKAGGGDALLASIKSDEQLLTQIGSEPIEGQDGAAYRSQAIFQFAKNRGLLPATPGVVATVAAAVGGLGDALQGADKFLRLNLALGTALAVGDTSTAAEAWREGNAVSTAGLEDAGRASMQLLFQGVGLGVKAANAASTALGRMSPQDQLTMNQRGDWLLYKTSTDVAAENQKAITQVQQVTNLPRQDVDQMVGAISFAANPVNLLPFGEAFSAVSGGAKLAVKSLFSLGSEKALTGLTESIGQDLVKQTAIHQALNDAFDTVARAGDSGNGAALEQAADAIKASRTKLDSIQQAFTASSTADTTAAAAMYKTPAAMRAAGAAMNGVGSALQVPAALKDWFNGKLNEVAGSMADGSPQAKKFLTGLGTGAAAAAGGAIAGEVLPDGEGGHPFAGALAGWIAARLGPQALRWTGRDLQAAGTQLTLGRASLPYFARLGADTSATPITRWIAGSVLDPLTPFAAPFLDAGAAGFKGSLAAAPIGAGLGFVQSGGTAAGAVGGAAGIAPLGFVAGLAGSLSPAYAANAAQVTAEADRQYLLRRWANDPTSKDRFGQLTYPQQLQIARWTTTSPDFTLLLQGQDNATLAAHGQTPVGSKGVMGGGLSFQGDNGQRYIAIDPSDPASVLAPIIAHEVRHLVQISDPGMSADIVRTMIGDPESETPGLYTRYDADGKPVVVRDPNTGIASYATTDEFQQQKQAYQQAVTQTTGRPHQITDSRFALERDAEETARTWLGTDVHDEAVRPTFSGILADKIQDAPFLRGILGKLGHAFTLDGDIAGPNSTYAGLKATPESQQLIRQYTEVWAQRSPDSEVPEPKGVDLSPEAIQKNPALLALLNGSMDIARDPKTGVPAGTAVDPATGQLMVTDPTKLFRKTSEISADVAKMTAAATQAVQDSVVANPSLPQDVVQPRTQKDGSVVMAGRYLSPDQLARIRASGAFSPIQLQQLESINTLLTSKDSNSLRAFYQPALKGGKYASRAGHWVEEVPYGFKISAADNILVQTVSPTKLARNLEFLWSKAKGPARDLWPTTASMFADADTYLRNLGARSPGATAIGIPKRDALNVALGLGGDGEVNPLHDSVSRKGLIPVITSRRLDRINRITPGLESIAPPAFSSKTYEAMKGNFRPAVLDQGVDAPAALTQDHIPKNSEVDASVEKWNLNPDEEEAYRGAVDSARQADKSALPLDPQYDPAGRPRFDVEDGETSLKVSPTRYDLVTAPEVQQIRDRNEDAYQAKLDGLKEKRAMPEANTDKIDAKTEALKSEWKETGQHAWRDEASSLLAERLAGEAETAKSEPSVQAGMGWYSKMRNWLQDKFGAGIEQFSQLLGATSARTPVAENFSQALDGLSRFSRGDYDDLLQRYDEHIQPIREQLENGTIDEDEARKQINQFDELPLRSNGKKFNANSQKVLQALYGNWLAQTSGPKTPNFAGNLSGRTSAATIDVWAARTARRLLYQDKAYNLDTGRISNAENRWRILRKAETGVEFARKIGLDVGGDFGFAQEAFGKAAEKLGMSPDDLQALLWFHEKHIWDENGWTKAAGKVKSSFESEASKLDTERLQAGVTTFTNPETHDPAVFDAKLKEAKQTLSELPGLVYGRVQRSEGLYGGATEPTFDLEGVVKRGTDLTPIVHKVIEIAKAADQTDCFVSRVVGADHLNARPAYELGFKAAQSWATVRELTKQLASSSFDGFTVAVDRRGRPIGLRSQYIPEISARFASDPSEHLTPDGVQRNSVIWSENARTAINSLPQSSLDLLSYDSEIHLDTLVFGRGEYDEALRDPDAFQGDLGAQLGRRSALLKR
jgi:hypothetical protein